MLLTKVTELNFLKETRYAYLYLPQEWSWGLQRFAFLKYYDALKRDSSL